LGVPRHPIRRTRGSHKSDARCKGVTGGAEAECTSRC
jgi:hypothetical protein